VSRLLTTTSTTIDHNPIAPHSTSSWGSGVVALVAVVVVVAAFIWLFFSYRQHLKDHELHDREHEDL
jgi:anti-sigma-K factor RskA